MRWEDLGISKAFSLLSSFKGFQMTPIRQIVGGALLFADISVFLLKVISSRGRRRRTALYWDVHHKCRANWTEHTIPPINHSIKHTKTGGKYLFSFSWFKKSIEKVYDIKPPDGGGPPGKYWRTIWTSLITNRNFGMEQTFHFIFDIVLERLLVSQNESYLWRMHIHCSRCCNFSLNQTIWKST